MKWSLAKLNDTTLIILAYVTIDLNGLNNCIHHFVHYVNPEQPPGVQLHQCSPPPPCVGNAGILTCLTPLLYHAPVDYTPWSTQEKREAILHHIISSLRDHLNAFVGLPPPSPLPPP